MKKVVQHPATAEAFTLRELLLIHAYLSPRDHALLKAVNRASTH